MISRRFLRIKIFQALYAFFQSEERNLRKSESELFLSIERMYDLYLFLLLIGDELVHLSNLKIEEAKQALTVFLRGMDKSMHFNVYRFGSQFEKLFKMSKPYTEDHLNRAVDYLSRVDADLGGTELLAPLRDIYDTRIRKRNNRKVILITDGEIGNEQEVSRLVQSNAQATSLFVVGIGYGPNEYLIKQMARSSGGAAECIAPGDRIEPRVLSLFKKVISGKINNCTIKWGYKVDQAPYSPVMYDEETTSLFGKTDSERGKLDRVIVTGEYMRSKQEWEIDVQAITGTDIPISLLWAREKIRDLEEGTASVSGSNQFKRKESNVRKTIIQLSKKYSILSRETSFIAVEKRLDSQHTTGDTVLRRIPVMLTKDWHGGAHHWVGTGLMSQTAGHIKSVGRGPRMNYFARAQFTTAETFEAEPILIPETAVARINQKNSLFAMLALQRAEGGFELDEAVTKIIGLSYDNLKGYAARMVGQGRFDRWVLLSTIIVLRVLEREFASDRTVWYDLIQKSQKWYENELSRVRPSIDGMDLADWADDYIQAQYK